jgi:branched-chain amino acid transport system substrate-binding protein
MQHLPFSRRRLLGSGLALGLLPACSPSADAVRIGIGQPLSGPLSELGKDMQRGAELAAETINAGRGVTIDGKRLAVEIVSKDDKADAQAGVTAARQLVDAGVIAAIAHLNSGVSIAAAPVYAKAGVVQLAISTNPRYTQLGLPTTLRLVANDDMQAQAMAQYAADTLKATRIVTLHDSTPYGQGLIDAAISVLARSQRPKPVVELKTDDKATDFAALIPQLQAAKPDLLMTTLADFQVEALLPQLDAAGLGTLTVLGSDTLKTPRLQAAAVGAHAVHSTTPIVAAQEFIGGKDFLAAFKKRFGGDPYYAAHYAYDVVFLLADALRRNDSLDKKKLLQRLRNFDGDAPVTGMMRMGDDGEQRSAAVGVYTLVKGSWELTTRSGRW